MLKYEDCLLIFVCLTITSQSFSMEVTLAKTGLIDENRYLDSYEKDDFKQKYEDNPGILNYLPSFGAFWQKDDGDKVLLEHEESEPEQKDPNSWGTWIRDSSVPLLGRGVSKNVIHELQKRTFANVPENILRVQEAVQELINKKQTSDLVKLIELLKRTGFEANQVTINSVCKYLKNEIVQVEDQYTMSIKILLAMQSKDAKEECINFYNIVSPLISVLLEKNKEELVNLDTKGHVVSKTLTLYNRILGQLSPEEYTPITYNKEYVNDCLILKDKIEEAQKKNSTRREYFETIERLLEAIKKLNEE